MKGPLVMEGGTLKRLELLFSTQEDEDELMKNGAHGLVRLKGAQANIAFLIRALHPGINQRDYEYF